MNVNSNLLNEVSNTFTKVMRSQSVANISIDIKLFMMKNKMRCNIADNPDQEYMFLLCDEIALYINERLSKLQFFNYYIENNFFPDIVEVEVDLEELHNYNLEHRSDYFLKYYEHVKKKYSPNTTIKEKLVDLEHHYSMEYAYNILLDNFIKEVIIDDKKESMLRLYRQFNTNQINEVINQCIINSIGCILKPF